ncbi:MAG: hypothetical protein ACLSGB_07465 [Dorea sp.]
MNVSRHPIFQRQDMHIFLNSADFICTGSTRWRCEDSDCGRSSDLQC